MIASMIIPHGGKHNNFAKSWKGYFSTSPKSKTIARTISGIVCSQSEAMGTESIGLVRGYESITPTLTLPDPKDRHVLTLSVGRGWAGALFSSGGLKNHSG